LVHINGSICLGHDYSRGPLPRPIVKGIGFVLKVACNDWRRSTIRIEAYLSNESNILINSGGSTSIPRLRIAYPSIFH